jgi:hypothetical protein
MAAHADEAAVAVAEPAPLTVAALPHALLLDDVLSRLPVDFRMLCSEMCRDWRAVLNERSLWLRLDLSPASGVSRSGSMVALLRAAGARADGQLETLDVSGCNDIPYNAVLEVVRANSVSLRELYLRNREIRFPLGNGWPLAEVEALLHAAPGLRACHADVFTDEPAEARAMLRNDPPFGAIQYNTIQYNSEQ